MKGRKKGRGYKKGNIFTMYKKERKVQKKKERKTEQKE